MRRLLFLACSGLIVLELTALLIGWLWLMVRNVPALLHPDYWWSALILGCAGLAFTLLWIWLWYDVCRYLMPGGEGWPSENKFRTPGLTFGLFTLVSSAIVFATLDYICCWIWDVSYHWTAVTLASLVQSLAVLIPSGYRSQAVEKPVVATFLPPEPVSESEPEIGFERHPD